MPAPLYTELLAAYLAEGELIRLVKMHRIYSLLMIDAVIFYQWGKNFVSQFVLLLGPNFYGRGSLQQANKMGSCQGYGQLGKVNRAQFESILSSHDQIMMIRLLFSYLG